MHDPDLSCIDDRRRKEVRAAALLGLDYVDVSEDQLTLTVFFLGKAPDGIEKENVRITGGRRIRDVGVTGISMVRQRDPTLDDAMEVSVDKPGDFSTYTLSLVKVDDKGHPTDQPMEGFDPRYDEVSFSFKATCPTDLDCKSEITCPPTPRIEPEINYLAKDYASFRQLILDRLSVLLPDWKEAHVPDLGIALVELLAYAGDYLSYYQDAVATEAYLGTARQRISVRRHARLVDYQMHEGVNARAWVTLCTDAPKYSLHPEQIFFITSLPVAPATQLLTAHDLANVPRGSYEIFEPLIPTSCGPSVREASSPTITIYSAHNEIHFYTWGDCECCLPVGATRATLVDRWVPMPGTQPEIQPGTPRTQPTTQPGNPESITRTPPAGEEPASPREGRDVQNQSDGPPGTVRALNLREGDVLIFEEVIGPKTGNPADADPRHRQAVRLTCVTLTVDKLYHSPYGQPLVEIEWAAEDALRFPLCISATAPPPDCTCMDNVSVARGNVILVDHGATSGEPLGNVPTESTTPRCPTDCRPPETEILPSLFRPLLHQRPLTFSQPLPLDCCASAVELVTQDPRQALPWITLSSIPPAPDGSGPLFTFDDLRDPANVAKRLKNPLDPTSQFLRALLSPGARQALDAWDGTTPLPEPLSTGLINEFKGLLESWKPQRDLLQSGGDDRNFVVEMDNDGYAHLRFGDGDLGRQPEAGTAFQASFRVGNGKAGNVGAETISCLVFRDILVSGLKIVPRNPLPARGGAEPEPLAEVKLFAPYAFRKVLERAITADDYAALAQEDARRLVERAPVATDEDGSAPCKCASRPRIKNVQRAEATLRWTGSWYEARVAIDPLGTEDPDAALLSEISNYLEPYRRMGHDLAVKGPQYVPLDIAMTVCVKPHYLRGHVEAVLLDVLSNRVLPAGRLGFFHPDNLTFGQGIYESQLVAVAQAVPGVESVQVTRLERYFEGPHTGLPETFEEQLGDEPLGAVLALGPLEIAQLDNDPSFPENGRFVLDMRGGR